MGVKSVRPCNGFALGTICVLALSAAPLLADQLQMQNGDRYAGNILSVTKDSVVLQSEVLGKITLPRNKVSALTFDSGATASNPPTASTIAAAPVKSANAATTNADLAASLHSLGANTNFIQQVRQQMLAGSPEGGQKYDELVSGLMSGKLNLADIRKEAKSSIDQINQLKHELGPEAGDSLDSYLTILQSFVDETEPTTAAPAQATPAANTFAAPPAVSSQPLRDTK